MKDQPVLFYCKDGVLYPVALNNEQQEMLNVICQVFSPLPVVIDQPQGKVVNLIMGREKQ